jgi:hypothetical protein
VKAVSKFFLTRKALSASIGLRHPLSGSDRDAVNVSHSGENNNDIARGSRDAKELSDAWVCIQLC